jgi:hypothetical protein
MLSSIGGVKMAEQPTSVAMNLATFPDEVWDQIFDFIYAESVVRLWNTGNKAIVRRMQKCTSLEVQFKPRREIIWPRKFLSSLPRLRKLIFGQPQAKSKPFALSVDITVLPRDLRVLELNCANGFVCFLQAAPAAPDPTVAFSDTKSELQFLNLRDQFPQLERISYVNEYWDQFMNYVPRPFFSMICSMSLTHLLLDISSMVSYKDLLSLPPTLQWLDIDMNHIGDEVSEAPQFPPLLSYLHLQGCPTTDFYGPFPSHLRTLIHGFDFGTFAADGIAQLPRTLTKYSVNTLGHFSTSMALGLPSTLRFLHLRVLSVDYDLEKHLPSSLEELVINASSERNGSDDPITIASVSSLPRSLTSFCFPDGLVPPPDQWNHLPRGLTSMECNLSAASANEFITLPPHLNHIAIESSNEFPSPSSIGNGFRSLTQLTITAARDSRNLNSLSASFFNFVAALPNVVRLKILTKFDTAHLDILKHSLIMLKVKFADWHKLNLKAPWAARLETLVFSNVIDPHPLVDDAGWMPTAKGTGLPPPKSKAAKSSAGFVDTEPFDEGIIEWFKMLPATLTQLQPGGTKERSLFALPGEVLKFLPPNLQKLKIRLETFPADMTRHLPRSLTKLVTFVKKASPLSAQDYNHLPLGLHQIRIPAPDVTDPQTLMPWVSQRPMLSSLYFHILSGARFRPISDAVHSRKRGLSLQQLFQESTGASN